MNPNIFTRAFDRRVKVLFGVLGFSIVLGITFGAQILWASHTEQGYQPAQPLEFRHDLMAGKRKIDCLYCHTEALTGPHAGIPTVQDCMKCHSQIQTKNAMGEIKEGIQILLDHAKNNEPIQWVKVHDLSDFVYFDHSRHLQPRTGLWCVDCHGKVETMDRVERANSLKMKWCLDCHRQAPPKGSPAWQKTRAPINCTTCHR